MALITQGKADPRSVMIAWFGRFSEALESGNCANLSALLHDDCYWRDLLTFGWKLQTQHGVAQIASWLKKSLVADAASNLRLSGEVSEAGLGDVYKNTIESFFDFETSVARGRGYVRLVLDPASVVGARAITIGTSMRELHGFPESIKLNRPRITSMVPPTTVAGSESATNYYDVVIVGAGQSGLMLGARLKQIGLSALIIERSTRISDIWRNRYSALKLHNETCMNHFPYMRFPESWPVYLPRDKVVSWLEFYAQSMELDVATSTTFLGGKFDTESGTWTSRLQKRGETEYALTSRFMVIAAGVSGLPEMPKVPGKESFKGKVLHSSEVNDSLDVRGKKLVVVGAGTSAHDIAQMSHMTGADVTMVQRSSITVVSLEPSAALPFGVYRNNDGVKHIDDVDLMYASVPFDLVRRVQVGMSQQMKKLDEELLKGLRKVGFLLDNGEDDTGWVMKLLRYQAGYYLNIGASDLITEGKIKLKAGVSVSKLDGSDVVFTDGTKVSADIVVFATGYQPLESTVAHLFGDDVAAKVGPIYGIGADGEIPGMYARTGQPNFFATGGGFAGARAYSRYMALLMKAQIEGLLPADRPVLEYGTSDRSAVAASDREVANAR